jgi:hypothetical protein
MVAIFHCQMGFWQLWSKWQTRLPFVQWLEVEATWKEAVGVKWQAIKSVHEKLSGQFLDLIVMSH